MANYEIIKEKKGENNEMKVFYYLLKLNPEKYYGAKWGFGIKGYRKREPTIYLFKTKAQAEEYYNKV